MVKNRIIAKILDYRREYGTLNLIGICLTTLKNTLFFYKKEVVGCILIEESLTKNPSSRPEIPLNVRPAVPSDVSELKKLTAGYKKRDFLQWINERFIFFVAQLVSVEAHKAGNGTPNKIVGYVCVCPASKSSHKLVSILKLTDTDYWALDAYIHPSYRGKGINSAMAAGFLAQAKREGFKRGYGSILYNNLASRRAYSLIGEKEIGIFITLTVAGFTFHFFKRNKGNEECFNG